MYTVYCHTNKLNGKRYVGITKKKPERRWQNGTAYAHNEYFYNAILKHGWEEFSHEILFTGLTKQKAEQIEKRLIKKWELTNRSRGYNIESGGNLGKEVSEETKKKQSVSAKQRVEKLGAPMTGRVYSEKDKLNMRKSCSHRAKPVVKYSLDGLYLCVYASVSDASRDVNGNKSRIIKCCKGVAETAYGFLWRYYVRES